MKIKEETKEFISYLIDNEVCSQLILGDKKELEHIQRVIGKSEEESLKIRKKNDRAIYECYSLWKTIKAAEAPVYEEIVPERD